MKLLPVVLAAALVPGFHTTAIAAAKLPVRPNILFLFTDDQRWDTVHALGNPEIKTPTFDRFVEQGFHFNNAFCQGSMIGAVCLPSRNAGCEFRTPF